MDRRLAGSLIAVLVVALIAWWVSGDRDVALDVRERGSSAEVASGDDFVREGSNAAAVPAVYERVEIDVGGSLDDAVGPELEAAEIEYRFVDAVTREAVPGVEYAVWSEHTRRQYGRGFADDDGRTVVRGLPLKKTIIVESGRADSYTHSLMASWLKEKRRHVVEVELVRGGIVFGRVLDGMGGSPVPGVEIRLERVRPGRGRQRVDTEIIGTTNGRGAFQVERLTKRGIGVWATDEGARPDNFEDATLTFEAEIDGEVRFHREFVSVADEETIDLGDVVLRAAPSWTGQVVDADGSPAPDVLVSADPRRVWALLWAGPDDDPSLFDTFARFPGDPRFEPTEHEVFTDSDGLFDVSLVAGARTLVLVTKFGQVSPTLPARGDNLVHRLPDTDPLFVRLVDEEGATRVIDTDWYYGSRRDWGVSVETRDGVVTDTNDVRPVAGGAYRVELEARMRDVLDVSVNVRGFVPARQRLATQIDAGDEVVVPLFTREEDDGLAFRLRFDLVRDELGVLEPGARAFVLCALAPERRTRRGDCCGLFVRKYIHGELPPTLEFEVPADRPYWVETEAWRVKGGALPRLAGPFSPGDTIHELPFGRHDEKALPEGHHAYWERQKAEREALEHSSSRGRLTVVLAVEPVDPFGPTASFDGYVKTKTKQRGPLTYEIEVRALPGERSFRLWCSNHDDYEGFATFIEDEAVDLGRVELPAAGPRREIRFVNAEGAPVTGARCQVDGAWTPPTTDSDGRVVFYSKEKSFSIWVEAEGRWHSEVVPLEVAAGARATITVPPAATAVITLTGIDDEFSRSEIQLGFSYPAGELPGTSPLTVTAPMSGTERQATLIQSPGRYRIHGGTGFLEFDEVVELRDTDEVQRFRISAKRR